MRGAYRRGETAKRTRRDAAIRRREPAAWRRRNAERTLKAAGMIAVPQEEREARFCEMNPDLRSLGKMDGQFTPIF